MSGAGSLSVGAVEAATASLRQIMVADGADLTVVSVEPGARRVTIRLELEGASCLDCVLPASALSSMLRAAIAGAVDQEFELVLVDPRP